jgi:hypothetical protein
LALEVVEKQCDGQFSSCDVSANNGVFGDPCPGIYKYLELEYECQPTNTVIVCEGHKDKM